MKNAYLTETLSASRTDALNESPLYHKWVQVEFFVPCFLCLFTHGGVSKQRELTSLAHSVSFSGQSYKQFMLVIYDPRVVIWGIFKSGPTLVS